MSLPRNHPTCGVCAHKLVKNGKTSAGRTRWRCKACGASATQARTDITRKAQFHAYYDWITSPSGRRSLDIPIRTFARQTDWCWNVAPELSPTGEVHTQVMLDGTYFNGWCVLIAYTGAHVIDWQWTDREKRASWAALLSRIPPTDYAIVDGNGPLKSTLRQLWPATRRQRCLFHVRQTATKHLTRTPVLPANKELLALYKALTPISSLDEAAAWIAAFTTWEARWHSFLKHRTYARPGVDRPRHVKPSQAWWYTHIRTRRAWKFLAELLRDEELFTWLRTPAGTTIDRTTSPLEGGPNKAVKDFLRHHRGLREDRARRGVDWLLYSFTEHPQEPWSFVRPEHWQPPSKEVHTRDEEPVGPAVYDTAFSPEDGNGVQKGWGGRAR